MTDPRYLSAAATDLRGRIELTGSKSIANRALIIQALTPGGFPLHRLAAADDTQRLQELLRSDEEVLDAGPAGTTFRFLTAYLCRRPGTQVLTGTERMKQRPIGILVDALRELGAEIEYVEKEGFPPLRIGESALAKTNELSISAGTSSQFISALLLIAPTLPIGLRLTLTGELVSRPYIQMTLNLLAHFGATSTWEGETIVVPTQPYRSREFTVEADWSAASYYYSLAALSDTADLQLDGLFADSVQGDSVVQEIYRGFGVNTEFNATGLRLTKAADAPVPALFDYNFTDCPDVAQTLAVTCAGRGVQAIMTGLKTLKIKETDRVAALRTELAKVGVHLNKLPAKFSPRSTEEHFMQEGRAAFSEEPVFATYEDHRMAMALAPLALLGRIGIEDPMVVVKSYPGFYDDLGRLGIA